MKDPGWRPAIAIAVRIATLRSVESDLLITLRGMTLFAFTTSVLLVPVSYLVTLGSVSSGSSVAASFVVGAVFAAISRAVAAPMPRPPPMIMQTLSAMA